ncbi:MAG: SMC-Scp complex subunit ScpB [Armatimonadetes bacterium CG07_land_8_20_14_0_80_40_9]|nr:MAG: SMC-Scp complex subunit ScpB [Armatimonadetes bacterium CG07_land_8_20_14_0_80_40_9]
MENNQAKNIIECLLFISDKPLTSRKLGEIVKVPGKEVVRLIEQLQFEYQGRGLKILEVGGGYQFSSREEYAPFVQQLIASSPKRLSQPALETLAIIAYRQPITRIEIESLRGVGTGGVLDTLQLRKLVKIVGRKKVLGAPFLYATTLDFLRYFGIKNLKELPKLKEEE